MDSQQTLDALSGFGFLLKDVSRLFSRNFQRHCAALGLTLAQCRVLGNLQRHEGISQARLAELTDTDPMTLGRLLSRMQADGLIERRPDPNDGRAHSLYLRRKALPVLEEIWQLSDQARAEALAGLDAADRSHLIVAMGRIRDNLVALTSQVPQLPAKAAGLPPAAARRSRAKPLGLHRKNRSMNKVPGAAPC